jgi:hypothetical protein
MAETAPISLSKFAFLHLLNFLVVRALVSRHVSGWRRLRVFRLSEAEQGRSFLWRKHHSRAIPGSAVRRVTRGDRRYERAGIDAVLDSFCRIG